MRRIFPAPRFFPLAAAVALLSVQFSCAARAVEASPSYLCNYVAQRKLCGVETFSRGDANAMMFDSKGLLTFAPNNLLVYSNDFSNKAWSGPSWRATRDSKRAPFGENAGWLVSATAPRGGPRQEVPVAAGFAHIATLYLAPARAHWAQLGLEGGRQRSVWVDLDACVAGTSDRDLFVTVAAAADGWCKIDLAFTPEQAAVSFSVTPASANGESARAGDDLHVFGAQLSRVTYQKTNTDYYPTAETPHFGPRFGYVQEGNRWLSAGLLLEDARSNVILHNSDLTKTVWKPGGSMKVVRDQPGVDGVVNGASRLIGGAARRAGTICQTARGSYHDWIASAFVKRVKGDGAVNLALDSAAGSANKKHWRRVAVTPEWTRVSFVERKVTDPSFCFQIAPGDEIAVQYVQAEKVPNETQALGATSPIATADMVESRSLEALTSDAPELLKASAFVVETSGHQPGTDMAMLGLANQRDELSIGLGESLDNRLYSSFPFPALTSADTADWTRINRAGVTWTLAPPTGAITLNGGPIATAEVDVAPLTRVYWGAEPGGGKSCGCFIRAWAAYNSLTQQQLKEKAAPGAPY